jgi:DNA-binding PadR family transcriptional regulator
MPKGKIKKTRMQRLLEIEHVREELEIIGSEHAQLANGIPWSLLPVDKHIYDGIIDSNGNFLFTIHDLISYLTSTSFGSGRGLFSKSVSEVEAALVSDDILEHKNDHTPYFKTEGQMEEYLASMDNNDLTLLAVYLCIRSSLPMLYGVLGMHHLVSEPNNFRPILKKLSSKGFLTSTYEPSDLPIFGASRIYYYTVTTAGVSYLKKRYPHLYFSDLSSGFSGNNKILHSYHTTLSALQVFTALRRQGYDVSLRYETLLLSDSRTYIHAFSKTPALNDVQVDCVISYNDSRICLEQDMSTEHVPKVIDKLKAYFSSGSIGYGPGNQLDTSSSSLIFACHVTDISGRTSVLKATAPFNITHAYLNREFYYALAYSIAHSDPNFACHGDDFWETRLVDYIVAACTMLKNTNDYSRDKDGLTKYEKRCDADHLHLTLDCVKEILAFYHHLDEQRYACATDALLAYSRYFNNTDDVLSAHADRLRSELQLYNYHYCATLQMRTALHRLYRIADYFVKELQEKKYLLREEQDHSSIGSDLGCIAAGFSTYVVPSLSLGKYLPFIISGSSSCATATLAVAKAFDHLTVLSPVSRTYFNVAPGYAGAPETLRGVHIDVLGGDYVLRLKNCAVPSSTKSLTICLEFAFDALSWTRSLLYCRIAKRRIDLATDPNNITQENELEKNDRKIIIVCESKVQISRFASVTDLYNKKTGLNSLLSPEEVCYILLSDLQQLSAGNSESLPFYLCSGDDVSPIVTL